MSRKAFVSPAPTNEYGQLLLDMHGATADLNGGDHDSLKHIKRPLHKTDRAFYESTNPGAVFAPFYYDETKVIGPAVRCNAAVLTNEANDIFTSQRRCPSLYRFDAVGDIPGTFWCIPQSEFVKAMNCAADIFVSRLHVPPNRTPSSAVRWRRDLVMQFHGAERVAARVQVHCAEAELLGIRRSIIDEYVPLALINSAVTVAEYTFDIAESIERTDGYAFRRPSLPQLLHERLEYVARVEGPPAALDVAISLFRQRDPFGPGDNDTEDDEEGPDAKASRAPSVVFLRDLEGVSKR